MVVKQQNHMVWIQPARTNTLYYLRMNTLLLLLEGQMSSIIQLRYHCAPISVECLGLTVRLTWLWRWLKAQDYYTFQEKQRRRLNGSDWKPLCFIFAPVSNGIGCYNVHNQIVLLLSIWTDWLPSVLIHITGVSLFWGIHWFWTKWMNAIKQFDLCVQSCLREN